MPALYAHMVDTPKPIGDFDAMLVTSTHVFMRDDLPKLPVIAVGDETAIMARDNGFDVVQTGDGGVKDLDLSPYNNILYPCATEPTSIPDNAHTWHVYETIESKDFSLDNTPEIITVFSAKAARYIATFNLENKVVLCLSDKISQIFEGQKMANIASCTYPRYDAMEYLIKQYLGAHT